MSERSRYRFGPLERRGLIAGWRGGQIASVAAGLVVAVLALRARTSPVTVAIAVCAVFGSVAFSCWPVGGRTGEEWFPTLVRWARTLLSGGRRRTALAPMAGRGVGRDGELRPGRVAGRPARSGRSAPSAVFSSLAVRSAEGGFRGSEMGLVLDRRTRTWTAVLALQGHSFALLGDDEKERRIRSWSGVLASLAGERSAVHRLQWVATTLPDDGSGVRNWATRHATLGPESSARRSYEALLDSSAPATSRHDVLLAVQIRLDRATARAVRVAGGGERGAAAVLSREVSALERSVAEADVVVEGVLTADDLAAVVRQAGNPRPTGQAGNRNSGAHNGGRPARSTSRTAGGWLWPLATEEEWSCVRTDGTWHAVYWVAEWPRVEVGPDFLGPLLLGSVRRTTSVVMEPMSPTEAVRRAEQARTADVADAELRRRGGFLATARRAKEAELVNRREAELADGHASFRFSGYVGVTAASRDELEAACEWTEQAAGQCRLELRRLYGAQEEAFSFTLPLARGLR